MCFVVFFSLAGIFVEKNLLFLANMLFAVESSICLWYFIIETVNKAELFCARHRVNFPLLELKQFVGIHLTERCWAEFQWLTTRIHKCVFQISKKPFSVVIYKLLVSFVLPFFSLDARMGTNMGANGCMFHAKTQSFVRIACQT